MECDALLEIGTEEIPARFFPKLLDDLKVRAQKILSENRLTLAGSETYGTPRRLVLRLLSLSDRQSDLVKEIKGPPKSAGETAAAGFAKSQGIKPEKLTIRNIEGKEYYFGKLEKKGEKIEKLLPQIFREIITGIYLPISMLWGEGNFKFVRPLHWILAVYGTKILNFDLGGLATNSITYAGRFSGSPPKTDGAKLKISSSNFEKFKSSLLKNYCLLDQSERKNKIKAEVCKLASEKGLKVVLDEELINETTFLCEYPTAVLGKFDEKFLSLPKEVLAASIKKNLKAFSTTSKDGKTQPFFIIINNGQNGKRSNSIIKGYEKVLIARLTDAKFFFEEDLKSPLFQKIEKLKGITLHEKLGNLHDKMGRIADLAGQIATELSLSAEERKNTLEIAKLCKTDLLTSMVYEFPELAGIMGREYYLREGGAEKIAWGIYEHYLPRFAGDELPASIEGTAVSLADKLDSLVGFIGINLIPSGSEDPFGLRRLTYGIVKMLLAKNLNVSLEKLIDISANIYRCHPNTKEFFEGQTEKIKNTVLDFIRGRLKNLLLDEKIRHDILEGVLAGEFISISDSYSRAKILQKEIGRPWLKPVFLTGDRIARITKDTQDSTFNSGEFINLHEKELYKIYLETKQKITDLCANHNYEEVLQCLADFSEPTEAFFNHVMVMVEEEKVRNNRLGLLKSIDSLFKRFADFTKIVM